MRRRAQALGTGLANVAPSNIYETSDGAYMVIAANIDPMFRRLCQAMGQPRLADDPRFVSHVARGHNMATLDGIIGEWTRTLPRRSSSRVLDANGVVCGPIYSIADIAADPHFQARDMILRRSDPRFGDIAVPGIAPKLSETPCEVRWSDTWDEGSHNRDVYGGLLAPPDEELAESRPRTSVEVTICDVAPRDGLQNDSTDARAGHAGRTLRPAGGGRHAADRDGEFRQSGTGADTGRRRGRGRGRASARRRLRRPRSKREGVRPAASTKCTTPSPRPETFNQRNQNASVEQSLATAERIVERAHADGSAST